MRVHELLITVTWAALGTGLLRIFYYAVRTEWPTNYVALETDRGVLVNRSTTRYLLFMFTPLCIVVLLVAVGADRSGGNSFGSAIATGAIHLAFVIGGHILLSVKGRASTPVAAIVILDGSITILSILAVSIGLTSAAHFSYIVPNADEFFSSLWTTSFVAIVAVSTVALSRKKYSDEAALAKSRHEAIDLEIYAREICRLREVDEEIIVAILHAENLQRPRWVRRAEVLKGKLSPRGSYGVMQITSEGPISDEESIRLAVDRQVTRASSASNTDDSQMSGAMEAFRDHNNNPRFRELAQALWFRLSYEAALRAQDNATSAASNTPTAPGANRQDLAVRIFRAAQDRLASDRLENLFLLTDLAALQALATALERIPPPSSKIEGEIARLINTLSQQNTEDR